MKICTEYGFAYDNRLFDLFLEIAEHIAMNMTKPFMPKNEKQYMFRLSKLVPFFAKLSSGSKCKNLKLLMTPTTSVATKAIAQFSTNNVFFFILKKLLTAL